MRHWSAYLRMRSSYQHICFNDVLGWGIRVVMLAFVKQITNSENMWNSTFKSINLLCPLVKLKCFLAPFDLLLFLLESTSNICAQWTWAQVECCVNVYTPTLCDSHLWIEWKLLRFLSICTLFVRLLVEESQMGCKFDGIKLWKESLWPIRLAYLLQ